MLVGESVPRPSRQSRVRPVAGPSGRPGLGSTTTPHRVRPLRFAVGGRDRPALLWAWSPPRCAPPFRLDARPRPRLVHTEPKGEAPLAPWPRRDPRRHRGLLLVRRWRCEPWVAARAQAVDGGGPAGGGGARGGHQRPPTGASSSGNDRLLDEAPEPEPAGHRHRAGLDRREVSQSGGASASRMSSRRPRLHPNDAEMTISQLPPRTRPTDADLTSRWPGARPVPYRVAAAKVTVMLDRRSSVPSTAKSRPPRDRAQLLFQSCRCDRVLWRRTRARPAPPGAARKGGTKRERHLVVGFADLVAYPPQPAERGRELAQWSAASGRGGRLISVPGAR